MEAIKFIKNIHKQYFGKIVDDLKDEDGNTYWYYYAKYCPSCVINKASYRRFKTCCSVCSEYQKDALPILDNDIKEIYHNYHTSNKLRELIICNDIELDKIYLCDYTIIILSNCKIKNIVCNKLIVKGSLEADDITVNNIDNIDNIKSENITLRARNDMVIDFECKKISIHGGNMFKYGRNVKYDKDTIKLTFTKKIDTLNLTKLNTYITVDNKYEIRHLEMKSCKRLDKINFDDKIESLVVSNSDNIINMPSNIMFNIKELKIEYSRIKSFYCPKLTKLHLVHCPLINDVNDYYNIEDLTIEKCKNFNNNVDKLINLKKFKYLSYSRNDSKNIFYLSCSLNKTKCNDITINGQKI